MRRIGLVGGTFDPIHNGHIVLARNAFEQFNLDSIMMMVSPDPPHKKEKKISDFVHRYNMVKLAAEDNPFITPSDYEVHLPVPSYSVQTLKALHKDFPDDKFYFIIGEDSLDNIESWFHPAELMQLTDLIVAVRHEVDDVKTIEEQASYLQAKYEANIYILKSDYVDISSTEIRRLASEGKSLHGLVPQKVEDYIWIEKLYMQ